MSVENGPERMAGTTESQLTRIIEVDGSLVEILTMQGYAEEKGVPDMQRTGRERALKEGYQQYVSQIIRPLQRRDGGFGRT